MKVAVSFVLSVMLAMMLAACAAGEAEGNDSEDDDADDADVDAIAMLAQSSDELVATTSYGWPLKPFDQQHPVRAFLNDPRQGGKGSEAFHFGIDIAAPDGTDVFAVESGTLYIQSAETVAIVAESGARTISYWHMKHEGLSDRQHVAKGQRLGVISAGWGHVHLAEVRAGQYLNPLRRGGITPFADHGPPTIDHVTLAKTVHGKIDLVVNAFDRTPIRVEDPQWAGMPVGVALLRWRVRRATKVVVPWTMGVDLRETMLDKTRFHAVFAPGTVQNHPNKQGTYNYFLSHDWDSRSLPNGDYVLEIEASDIRDNHSSKEFPFTIAN